MKTFTNLAHRAFKKCASLGTTNRNRYYLFSIIMLLTLGVGNAWAEETESLECTTGTIVDNTMTWQLTSCTIVHSKGSNANYVANDPWKVYQGAVVTFTPKEDITISKIVITANSPSYATAGKETWTNATATVSSDKITVVPEDGSDVVQLTAGKQTRWDALEITYEVSGGGSTPATPYTVKFYKTSTTFDEVPETEAGSGVTPPTMEAECGEWSFQGWSESFSNSETSTTVLSTITLENGKYYPTADVNLYPVYTKTSTGGGIVTWNKVTTAPADWSGEYLIVNSNYAMTSDFREGNAGEFLGASVTVSNNQVTSSPTDKMIWIVEKNGNTAQYSFKNKSTGTYAKITGTSSTNAALSNTVVWFTIGTSSTSGVWKINSVDQSTRCFSYFSNYKTFRTYANSSNTTGNLYKKEGSSSTTYYYSYPECSGEPVTPAASLTANPTSLDFGNVTQNDVVEAKTFTISGSDFKSGELTITAPEGYSVSPTTVAVDGTLEEQTITVTPNTSNVGPFNGNVTISGANLKSSVNVALSMTVEKALATPTSTVYVKVTSTAGITDGEYLIVYEDAGGNPKAPVAFDGSLAPVKLDVVSNNIEVSIASNTIAGNTDIDAATFTINTTASTIQTKDGYYIGQTSNENGLATSTTTEYTNTISIENDGSATIISSGGAYLRYNSDVNNWRFRYYKSSSYSGQKAIALYKKASKHTVTIADCTNGSVSAKMGETALATNDQVLSGIQITLSNEAAIGYKLAAYDVYKTDDATTKVTVTDGKFIMPEFDVTISATFEAAKTLNSIEITTPATQTTFWQNETFNHDGLKVTAHFDGAADEDVTDKVTVNGSTVNAGTVAVEVSFTEGSTTKTTNYDITVKATANGKETAYDVATAREIIDKVSTADNVYVTGIVSEIVTPYNSEYGNITYNISADGLTTSNQLQAFRGKSYNGENFTSYDDIQVGDEVVVFGNLLKYNSTYELNAGNQLVDLKRDKQQSELSYTTTEYNVNLGDAFTAPTLNNPHTLAVTYSSSNEDVATVDETDGAVTIKAAGTVTITASFAGDENYVAGSASYTINITDPNQLEVTFDATQDLDANNTTKGEGKITKSPITFACTDGILGSSTYNHYRIYAYANATFSAAEGYIITKVVLTSTASNTSQYGPGLLSTEEGEGTYTYSGKEGTWVGEAYTVTLTASAQTRATLITVYYKQDNRVDAGIAWNPTTVSLTVGDAFTAPTFSNPNHLEVSFESSNTELATVNNAGVISLVSGKTGTATITATYAGDATYKPAEVTCVITVSPKSEKVVILAEYNGQWYALKNAEEIAGKVLAALPVNYVGGKLYNVADADKETIEWQLAIDGTIATFKNGENYISGTAGSANMTLVTTECEWTYDGSSYMIGERTFLYRAQANGFKNYNAEDNAGTADYSSLPVVTAPVYETGAAYSRSTTAGKLGTICLPFGSTNYTGATFYEFVGSETGKVYLGSVTTLEAGVPYIFEASAAEVAVYGDGTTAVSPGSKNGLVGTFTNDTEVAVGNYILKENKLCQAADICYVNANRAYIVMSEVPNGKPNKVAGRKYIGMDVQGENVETGVEDLFTTDAPVKVIENGQLIIIRDGVKYNVQGQKL